MNYSKKITLATLFGAAALYAGSAQAAVLLVVDLSVTDQVTITSTTGTSDLTLSGFAVIGVYLENFYGVAAGSPLGVTLVSGDLTNAENPSNSSPDLFRNDTDPGLNIYSWSPDATVTFTAGSVAFVGSATWSLTAAAYADMLAGSSSGDLYFPADTVDGITALTPIGTFTVVVPEPGSASLLALSFGMLFFRRKR